MSAPFETVTFLGSISFASDVYVRGYTKKDGTYIQPHYRTSPNSTKSDNYTTKGNYNPYTGKEGTKEVDSYSQDYGSGGKSED
ncbi:MAG: hypothetical protein IPL83_12880 [Bdellovibrionales bacterium]|nr:hypothetical protein [Bdellovibrionales bacterium]